jgi:hypothetical protein
MTASGPRPAGRSLLYDRSALRPEADTLNQGFIPVQFWAVRVYDLETAAFIRDARHVELNSYQEMQKNPDGSVDVFFGPTAPAGKEANWVYTAAGKQLISLFRFYGPEKAVFEKTWTLPDIEEVK